MSLAMRPNEVNIEVQYDCILRQRTAAGAVTNGRRAV